MLAFIFISRFLIAEQKALGQVSKLPDKIRNGQRVPHDAGQSRDIAWTDNIPVVEIRGKIYAAVIDLGKHFRSVFMDLLINDRPIGPALSSLGTGTP